MGAVMSNCSIWGLLASWGGYLGVTCCLSCERGLLATRPDSTLTRGSGLRRRVMRLDSNRWSAGKVQRDGLRGNMTIVALGSTAISVLVDGELYRGGKYIVADLFIVILGNGLVMPVMERVMVVVVLQ